MVGERMRSSRRLVLVEVGRFERQARAWMKGDSPFVVGALWDPRRKLRSGGGSGARVSSGRAEPLYPLPSDRLPDRRLSFPFQVVLSA